MLRPGNQPSCIACRVSENAPVMIAWLAMMVANVASTTSGTTAHCGASAEERVRRQLGAPSISTPIWPP